VEVACTDITLVTSPVAARSARSDPDVKLPIKCFSARFVQGEHETGGDAL
jgi:hypothetical protein